MKNIGKPCAGKPHARFAPPAYSTKFPDKDQVSQDRFKEMVVEEYNFHNEDGDEGFAEELQKRLEQLEVKTGKNNLNQK